jgi:hypothetical protein
MPKQSKKQDKGGAIDLGAVAAPVVLYGIHSLMTANKKTTPPPSANKKPRRFTRGGDGSAELATEALTSAMDMYCDKKNVATPAATEQPVSVMAEELMPAVAPGTTGGKQQKRKGGMRDLLDRLLQRGGENGMMVANQDVAPPATTVGVSTPSSGGEVEGAVDKTALLNVTMGQVETPEPVPMVGGKKSMKKSKKQMKKGGDDEADQEQDGGKKKSKKQMKKGGDDEADQDQQQGGKKQKKGGKKQQKKGGADEVQQQLDDAKQDAQLADDDQEQQQQGGKKQKKGGKKQQKKGGADAEYFQEQLAADLEMINQQQGGKKQKKQTKGGALDMYAQQLDQIMKGLQGMMA